MRDRSLRRIGSGKADGMAAGKIGVDQHQRAFRPVLKAECVEIGNIVERGQGRKPVRRTREVIRQVAGDRAGVHGADDRLVHQFDAQELRTHVIRRAPHVDHITP